ncbi:MAG: hypothetical protein GY830_09070 [Bacteroidetes bacterium]|nr:hypothetical protein [Bacteroidota bacterium]
MKLASKAKYLFKQQNAEEKKKLLKLLVSNSTYNGKNLLFSMQKPFDSIIECKKVGNWGQKEDVFRTKYYAELKIIESEINQFKIAMGF